MKYEGCETKAGVCVVLTTCPDEAAAARVARVLVERGLAACVTRSPGAASVYRWRGKIEEASEVQLFIKTHRACLPQLTGALKKLHPYEEPEMLVLDAGGGSLGYLGWIMEETRGETIG